MNDPVKQAEQEIFRLVKEARVTLAKQVKLTRKQAWEIGRLISQSKDQLKHGEFLPWVRQHLSAHTGLTPRSLIGYHCFYERNKHISDVGNLPSIRSVDRAATEVCAEEVAEAGKTFLPRAAAGSTKAPKPPERTSPHEEWLEQLEAVIQDAPQYLRRFKSEKRIEIMRRIADFAERTIKES